MSFDLTHKFVSPKVDGADPTQVKPSNWNDTHAVTGLLPVGNGGTGTATPSLVAGANVAVSGSFPNQTVGVTGLLPVANGGTGTATPSLVAGTNVTITGTFPNQTVNATGGGGGGLNALGPYLTDGGGHFFTGDTFQPATPPNGVLTTWLSQGTSTETNANGSLNMAFQTDSVIHSFLTPTYPGTPFTRVLCVTMDGVVTGGESGICLVVTDGTKLTILVVGVSGSTQLLARVINFSNPSTFSSSVASVSMPSIPPVMWLKFSDDGVNFTFSISSTGINYMQIAQVARGSFLAAPTGIGVASASDHPAGALMLATVLSFA